MNILPNARMLIIHDDLDDMSLAVARRIATSAAEAIADRGSFNLVLAGGETPRRCYERLQKLPVFWDQVQVCFSDERCLPKNDNRRNDTMARDALLNHVDIPPTNIHAIPAELGAGEAASRYAALLEHVGMLDLVLLGMGEDGHTASLFPGYSAAAAATVAVYDAPKPPAERVSLSMKTLIAARQKIFMVSGAGKRDALQRILQGELLPAACVASAEWHIDRAALPESF